MNETVQVAVPMPGEALYTYSVPPHLVEVGELLIPCQSFKRVFIRTGIAMK